MIVVYLLHFARRYPRGRQPQHYIGVAADLDRRMGEHRAGSAKSRLTRAFPFRGYPFHRRPNVDTGRRGGSVRP